MSWIRGIAALAVILTCTERPYAQESVVVHSVRKFDGNLVFQKGSKWALVVGVNKYEKAGPLQFCVNDARVLSKILQHQGGYLPQQIVTLVDDPDQPKSHPTATNITQQLTEMLSRVAADDTVVVSFSGHGGKIIDAKGNSKYYLIPIDFDGNEKTAIEMGTLRALLEKSKARQKLLILDCCHAGGAKAVLPLNAKQVTTTGATPAELQSVFANAKGIWTLTSCRAAETSLEWPAKQHGVFTYFLADGLGGNADFDRDGFITVHELALYALLHVPVTARDIGLKDHAQNPDLIIPPENEGNMIVALVPQQLPQAIPPQIPPGRRFDRARLRADTDAIIQAALDGQLAAAEPQARGRIQNWQAAGVPIPWELECLHGAILLRLALEIVGQPANAAKAQATFAEAKNLLELAYFKAPGAQSALPAVLLARACNNLAINSNGLARVQFYRRAHDVTGHLLDPRAGIPQLTPQQKAQCHYLLWFVQANGAGTGLGCVLPQNAQSNLNSSLNAFRSMQATNASQGLNLLAPNGLSDLFSEFDDLKKIIR